MIDDCQNCGRKRRLSILRDRKSNRKAFVCQECIMNEKTHAAKRISNQEIGIPV